MSPKLRQLQALFGPYWRPSINKGNVRPPAGVVTLTHITHKADCRSEANNQNFYTFTMTSKYVISDFRGVWKRRCRPSGDFRLDTKTTAGSLYKFCGFIKSRLRAEHTQIFRNVNRVIRRTIGHTHTHNCMYICIYLATDSWQCLIKCLAKTSLFHSRRLSACQINV